MLSTDVRDRTRQGIVGGWCYHGVGDEWFTGWNSTPQAVKIVTVTVTDQGDDDDVIITVNGKDVTYNTGTGKSLATIGAELAAAINAEPLAGAVAVASFDTATLTLTGRYPGLDWSVSIASDPDSVLSAVTTTQSAAEAEAVPFGRAVIYTGRNTGESEMLVGLAKSSLFTAQVQTLSIAYISGAKITVSVYEVRGGQRIHLRSVTETSASSQDATIDALIANLNAELPANTVNVTADNASATAAIFTAEIPGFEFDVEYSIGDEGASIPAVTKSLTTGPNRSTSIHRALVGISCQSPMDPSPTIGGTEGSYAGNAGVIIANKGWLWVESAQAPVFGDDIYVELGVSADNGQLFTTSSATRVALSRSALKWEMDGVTSADGIAAVRISV